jgi:protein-tyrosine phosphatase
MDISAMLLEDSRRLVDIHCHCLPGLDDGPASMAEAVTLCETLAADNTGLVVATPHQLGRFEQKTPAREVRRAVERLNRELAERAINLRVLPGGEVRLDERIGELLALDESLSLADVHRHVLLELPAEIFIDAGSLFDELGSHGLDVIIAHPERNLPLLAQPQILRRWLDRGVSLQVTAGSLAGHFGREVMQVAWELLGLGWVTCLATDAHGRTSGHVGLGVAFEMIAARLGEDAARLLCVENPLRMAKGQRPLSLHSRQKQEVG